MIVAKCSTPGHGDLVVVEVEGFQQLYRLWRPGPRWRLLPVQGGESIIAHVDIMRGVVVSHFRETPEGLTEQAFQRPQRGHHLIVL